MGILSSLLGASKKSEEIKQAIAQGAVIVDVRSPGEYTQGHAKGSMNIPVQNVQRSLKKFKPETTVILCCRSGARAGSVQGIFEAHGCRTINAGPWQNVVKAQS